MIEYITQVAEVLLSMCIIQLEICIQGMTMKRILVIDDETILRGEVIEWLTLEGYKAEGATNGFEGINRAFAHVPNLVICDITMPELDGHGVLLELRANPATATIPFIFVTARATHEDIRKGMSLGADDYITKPFTRLELLQAVESRLSKQAAFEQKHQQDIDKLSEALTYEHERRQLNTKLVAMFSHDLRTPMASILASTNLLRDYGQRMERERQEIHYGRIESSTRRLLQMLDDLLVIAQMEIGKLEYAPEVLNFGQFVQELVDEFQIIHRQTHRIKYEYNIHHDATGDPRLIRQIVTNLLTNAIKYSPEGSKVYVSLKRTEADLALTIRDEGIGIPEADLPRLFVSFERASNVGDIAGTGLGLAIVKQAVDLHGGTLTLESRVNIGTTVTVNIPLHV
jgi:two-component system, sensor histidine kinase and response regulator